MTANGPKPDILVWLGEGRLMAQPSRPGHRLRIYGDGALYVSIGWKVLVDAPRPQWARTANGGHCQAVGLRLPVMFAAMDPVSTKWMFGRLGADGRPAIVS